MGSLAQFPSLPAASHSQVIMAWILLASLIRMTRRAFSEKAEDDRRSIEAARELGAILPTWRNQSIVAATAKWSLGREAATAAAAYATAAEDKEKLDAASLVIRGIA